MTERMRVRASDALSTLRTLLERGYHVQASRRDALHTLEIGLLPQPSPDTRYYDAGTLDDALLLVNLDDYPARAA